MFKFVVLSCLVSVALAGVAYTPVEYAQVKTVVEPHHTVVETPTITHVGSKVHNIPTGVSHHSSSVVHSHVQTAENIYAHGVEKKIISTPVVKQVVEEVYAPAPAVKYVQAPVAYAAPAHYAAPAISYAAPAVKYVSAPAAYAAPAYSAYAAPAVKYVSAPAAYAAPAHYAAAPAHYAAAYPSAYSTYAHHY
jgi:Drosophila Retinin like protein